MLIRTRKRRKLKIVALITMIIYLFGPGEILAAQYACGTDLDGDGDIASVGETAECKSATSIGNPASQWLCPIEAIDCTKNYLPVTTSKSCEDTSFSYVAARDRCEKAPACASGTYNPANNQCDGGATSPAQTTYSSCSGSLTKPTNSYYHSTPCTATPGNSCSIGYTIELRFFKFFYTARFNNECLWTDLNYKSTNTVINLAPGTVYQVNSSERRENTSTGVLTCPPGTTLSGTSCQAPPTPSCGTGSLDTSQDVCFMPVKTTTTCAQGSLDPASGQCYLGTYSCPSGNFACLDPGNGTPQCTPNRCFDTTSPTVVTTEPDIQPEMMQNDGAVSADGSCMDKIYIFSGSKSRCRPPGLTVGTMNNCCSSDEPVMSDSKTGNKITTATSAITTAYEIGQVAYYGSALATGTASISAITGTTGAITSMTVVTAGGATTTLSGAAATGAYGAMASGATTTGAAVSAGMQSYAAALFNPATIAFAAAAYIAIKVLMGNGCDEKDIMTAMLRDSGNCHYLGKVCERRWPTGCVQRSMRFCCFNSKMGRIIHEQGRPQLKSFGPDGAWGTPNEPNCRGFTTEEFQMLDFSKIDMSEYFADMQKGLQQQIQDSQQKTMEKVQQHYQQAL